MFNNKTATQLGVTGSELRSPCTEAMDRLHDLQRGNAQAMNTLEARLASVLRDREPSPCSEQSCRSAGISTHHEILLLACDYELSMSEAIGDLLQRLTV